MEKLTKKWIEEKYPTPPQEKGVEWEKEFDEKWNGGDDGLFVTEKVGLDSTRELIKKYIRQNFLPKSRLKEIVGEENDNLAVASEFREGWNACRQEILNRIEKL